MTDSLFACLITAAGALLAAGWITPRKHLGYGDSWISFAIGALAGTALLDALPHAWEDFGTAHGALSLLLLGAVCCLALDRLFHCRPTAHAHGEHCYLASGNGTPASRRPERILLAGDFLHSVVDGSLIAAAFSTSFTLGVIAAGAILIHEIPRKCATVLMLRHSGRSARGALALGALASLGVVAGAVIARLSLGAISEASSLLLVCAASMMLYVAIVELLPILRSGGRTRITLSQAMFMLAGAISVSGTHWVVEAAA